MCGDGDGKSFNSTQNIYGDEIPVKKHECIEHSERPINNRLRKLRKEKKLGRKNRFTNSKIDTLQKYFGTVLRQNIGNFEK